MPKLTVPALYVDAVTSAETYTEDGDPVVILANRVPGPGEVDAESSTTIAIDLYRSAASAAAVDDTQTTIYVNGVEAYGSGSFKAGFDGPASLWSALPPPFVGDGGKRVVVDPTSDFTSLEVVTVRVVSELVGGIGAIDESWTFTVEDLDAPALVSALAIDQTTIRLTFDESVAIGSGFAATITAQTAPAVGLVVESQSASGSFLDLTVDQEMTPGATYAVEVSDVEDLSGNAAAVSTTVEGFSPITPDRRSFSLATMVPARVLSLDERGAGDLRKFLAVLQDTLDLIFAELDGLTDQLSIELARQPWLDLILLDLGNPFSFVLSDLDKRKLASILVQIYRQNGTVEGIENAILFFVGVDATVVEFSKIGWVLGVDALNVSTELGPGDSRSLYTFAIEVVGELTDEQREQITEIAIFMKPAHTHLAEIIEQVDPELWTLDVSALDSSTVLG